MTTWNAADKSAGTTLSGGDLIATGAANGDGARSTTSKSSGKVAFSVGSVPNFAAGTASIGFSQASEPYLPAFGTPGQLAGLIYFPGTGYAVLYNGGILAGPDAGSPAPTSSSVVTALLDSAGLIYFQCDGSNLFGANPASGTGGLSISTGAWFANIGFGAAGSATANFSPGSLPSGFSAWDGGGGGSTYTLTAAQGSFAVSGQAANLVRSDPTTPQTQTSSGSWTFLTSGTLVLEAWGPGASGARRGRGAGGGAYAKTNSVPVTAGQTLYWNVPAGPAGTTSTTGGTPASDAWARVGTNSAPSSTTDGVLAAKGAAGTSTVNGAGGTTAASVGDTKFAGGAGGNTGSGTTLTGGGGSSAGTGSNGNSASGNTAGSAPTGGFAGGTGGTGATGGAGSAPGGGGGSTSNGSGTGGAGTRGQVIWAFTQSSGAYTLTADQGSVALSGQPAALRNARKLVADMGSRSLTGFDAQLRKGYNLPAAQGGFSLAGQNAILRYARVLGAGQGAFALAGQNARLAISYTLSATGGNFGVSGQAATLRVARILQAASASFGVTGIAADLIYTPAGTSYTLVAGLGSFAVNGQQATLRKASKLVGTAGSFALAGQNAVLRTGRKLVAGNGLLSVSGQPAGLGYGRKLIASLGTIVVTGQSATLKYGRVLPSGYGSFSLTGFDADLIKGSSGAYVLVADGALFSLQGYGAELIYTPGIGVTNPLEKLKMYTGTLGAVSNREDWIVNLSFVGDDGTLFDLSTASEIEVFVCRQGCPDSPVLSASLGDGIVLTDSTHMQWAFTAEKMSNLCAAQYDVYSRIIINDIVTQTIAAGMPVIEGGPR